MHLTVSFSPLFVFAVGVGPQSSAESDPAVSFVLACLTVLPLRICLAIADQVDFMQKIYNLLLHFISFVILSIYTYLQLLASKCISITQFGFISRMSF